MKTYFNEKFFIKYIKTVLEEKRIIVTGTTLLFDDYIEPKFKVETVCGTYFAKFSRYNQFQKEFFEIKELKSLNGTVCLLPFVSKNLPDINRQLNIYNWLVGENLRSFLQNRKEKHHYEYGIKSGELLKRLHNVAISNEISRFDIDNYIVRILAILRSDECMLNYKSLWLKLVNENTDFLKRRSKDSLIHFDFKPKNIMLSNDKLILIDFDSFSVGDPWLDFSDKGLAIYKEKQAFNKGIIDGYFNNNIPNEFWRFLKTVSICAMIQTSSWKINKDNKNYIYSIEDHLLESYCDVSHDIPKWYKSIINNF